MPKQIPTVIIDRKTTTTIRAAIFAVALTAGCGGGVTGGGGPDNSGGTAGASAPGGGRSGGAPGGGAGPGGAGNPIDGSAGRGGATGAAGIGAGAGGSSAGGAGGASMGGAPGAHVLGQPGGLPATAAAFDDTVIHTYVITAAPAELAKLPMLAKNPMTENMYVPATAIVDGDNVGMVGIRFKGAYGTLQSCIDKTFKVTCPKMSYKVKFDAFDMNKRFKGLKKVNLHAMIADQTKMHEHIAYKLYRDMGLVASRSAHAKVTINGEVRGLYAVTEAPDGRFTADRFAPDGDGNLYKEVWPTSTDPKYYQSHLETNEDMVMTHDKFIAFATELKASQVPAELTKTLDKWASMDYMLRYNAVDRIISNWDGMVTFACADRDASSPMSR